MKTFKSLLSALAYLALAALVLFAFAYCVAEFLVGGVL